MGWEGQKEGFAPIQPKLAKGKSGISPMYMFPNQEVGNPAITSIGEIIDPIKKTVTMTTVYETSVS